jgi:hypothetical protein
VAKQNSDSYLASETIRKMDAAEAIMREDRDILRELAK